MLVNQLMTCLDQLETVSKQFKLDFPAGIHVSIMMLHGCKIMHIKKLQWAKQHLSFQIYYFHTQIDYN